MILYREKLVKHLKKFITSFLIKKQQLMEFSLTGNELAHHGQWFATVEFMCVLVGTVHLCQNYVGGNVTSQI